MKIKFNLSWFHSSVFIFCLLSLSVSAQKQPKTQKGSVRAPADIKIDGSITEWPYNLQAFNNTSRVYYAVSNDDINLYLTLRTTGLSAALKILEGGLTFTVKTKANNVSVTYPTGNERQKIQALVDISYHYDDLSLDTINNKKSIDSVRRAVNGRIDELFTDMKITGIKEITRPAIALQNTYGIQAKAQYNSRMQYIYELAVPLKYLGLSVDNPEKFKYNVILNPIWSQEVIMNGKFPPPVVLSNEVSFPNNSEYLYNNAPTSIGGDYMLAK